jgi:hypothetical protein
MIVVRYATLAALVLWLGLMIGARFGDMMGHMPLLTPACGAVMLVGLFAMKFMGPPPHSFVPRIAIVFVMLLITAASVWWRLSATAAVTLPVNIALGFLLLSWYARE